MKIMGMSMGKYYLTWFIRYFVIYIIVHGIISGVFSYIMKYIPFYVFFILFILFDIVLILQSFFIQVFLSRAKLGVVISLLLFAIQFILSVISTNSKNPTL